MSRALVVTVPVTEAELASDVLWSLGVLAIEERTLDAGSGAAMVELWTALGANAEEVIGAGAGFPATWRWRTVEVDDAVANTWRDFAEPTWVTHELVIVPAWKQADVGDAVAIRIEPGASFGLGDHSTTLLSLRAMVGSIFDGALVLDVGCGSGVLGITAAKLGAARVEAIDISAAAVEATMANAALNGVSGRVNASTSALAEIDETFDIVVANILAPALIALAPDLQRVLGPSGVLIISGVLDGRYDHVVEALAPLTVIQVMDRQGWVALTLRH